MICKQSKIHETSFCTPIISNNVSKPKKFKNTLTVLPPVASLQSAVFCFFCLILRKCWTRRDLSSFKETEKKPFLCLCFAPCGVCCCGQTAFVKLVFLSQKLTAQQMVYSTAPFPRTILPILFFPFPSNHSSEKHSVMYDLKRDLCFDAATWPQLMTNQQILDTSVAQRRCPFESDSLLL